MDEIGQVIEGDADLKSEKANDLEESLKDDAKFADFMKKVEAYESNKNNTKGGRRKKGASHSAVPCVSLY